MMKLTFLGATETVTGSKYLVEANHKKILVDCGLFQGYKELRLRNWAPLPINPASIDAVLLTHAHIDHTGYLPLFVKNGFTGPIYCTPGTKDLCAILLPDSGHLQEEEAKNANKYGYTKHHPAQPLYTIDDAQLALKQFHPKDYDAVFEPIKEINVQFIPAGHIIGSSFVHMKDHNTSLLFTGDMGRPHDFVMQAPSLIEEIDYLVIESTYGNRLHDKTSPTELLKNIINKTVQRGGSIIIPAFAVARAQSVLHYIALLKQQKSIPDIPVFLDSPMAINATHILCHHKEDHRLSEQECKNLCDTATYIRTPEESKQLDSNHFPKIIISASGMATGGRILFHLKAYAPHHENTILFAGYQAGGTRGARMIQGETEIKIHGQMVPVKAQVESLSNLSAHADYEELLHWLSHFRKPPKKVFITHGEPNAASSLKTKIEQQFGWTCIVPHYQQTEELT
ncbi:metallo-beta lactamase family transporter protein [Legionella waltersii]|uniref:Metallo-beta lactamase family transporter protein n=2 Tax=Legionella waltersii TaxID=66969 RepID=A0A0W1AMI6_9GAMM|nr:metallo-beta lactamase family transporter protein [Legionella waltersii]SNU95214.1 putative mRNA Cleavage and polyadenylation specificity factor [Legionella waltersii]